MIMKLLLWFFLCYSSQTNFPHKLAALLFIVFFYVDLLFTCSGRSSIFESPKREDLPLLEVAAKMGLWYGLNCTYCYTHISKLLMSKFLLYIHNVPHHKNLVMNLTKNLNPNQSSPSVVETVLL